MSDLRWAWAEIDLDAVRHNVRLLRDHVAPSAVWAVVKANGYGHGAVDVARAAIDGGAEGLCVATVQEGAELRHARIDAPIMLLSEPPPETAAAVVANRLTPMVYRREFFDQLVDEGPSGLPVHLLIDTGMQRVGAHPHAAAAKAAAIAARAPALRLAGIATHLAVADQTDDESRMVTNQQLEKFAQALEGMPPVPALHVANSAAAITNPLARLSFVRAGIAIYGISPGPDLDHHPLVRQLRPAMELRSRVSFVKQVRAGSRISYGLRHRFAQDTTVATLPLGYADGVPRRLSEVGGEVLLGGRRCPMVGAVTMDQLMVDCGDADVRVGDDVVLIGAQGDDRIRAEDWARMLGTIAYEIVCSVSARIARVPRRSIDG